MARRRLAPPNCLGEVFREFMSGIGPTVAALEPLVLLSGEKHEMVAAMARDFNGFVQCQVLESADLPLKFLRFDACHVGSLKSALVELS